MEVLTGSTLGRLRVIRTHANGPLSPAKGSLAIRKGEQELFLRQLSDGERRLVLLVADTARRMVVLNPMAPDALETTGVLLIDEIELHLHPLWQRTVVPAIQAAFPQLQVIATTHAPAVLSTVPNESIVVLDQGRVLPGVRRACNLDANSILKGLMGTSEFPTALQESFDALYRLIDTDPPTAQAHLDEMEGTLGPDHPELVRARALLAFLES